MANGNHPFELQSTLRHIGGTAVAESGTTCSTYLKVMTIAGFGVRDHNLLMIGKPTYGIADPIVRFHRACWTC